MRVLCRRVLVERLCFKSFGSEVLDRSILGEHKFLELLARSQRLSNRVQISTFIPAFAYERRFILPCLTAHLWHEIDHLYVAVLAINPFFILKNSWIVIIFIDKATDQEPVLDDLPKLDEFCIHDFGIAVHPVQPAAAARGIVEDAVAPVA